MVSLLDKLSVLARGLAWRSLHVGVDVLLIS